MDFMTHQSVFKLFFEEELINVLSKWSAHRSGKVVDVV